ncbi:beta lactamase like protein [Dothistroma septosporum NZE10]|uniref:Beta lactamase like protein n=1 Tax=Dothistroma septosporum (strain NZE10 / CBS 128990) TaxID=675120 RepID=M2WIG1_DOTSN|nr:beta lactamase like protein [Dothistroma septosporum NZE10]
MDSFDQALRDATAKGVLPGTCVIAADKQGNILHSASSGSYINSPIWQTRLASEGLSAQAKPPAEVEHDSKPFGPDTVCWIASMTKLLTTVCVMKCVEQDLLKLDDDVTTTFLPEFEDVQVLERMEDDGKSGETPVLRPSKGKITLRNLLIHSSGITYEFMHAKLLSWRLWNNADLRRQGIKKTHEDRTEVSHAYRVPLVFDPETSWTYGYGIDWAGLVLERATSQTLESFMRQHIFTPLSMDDTTFEPLKLPHLASRIAGMTVRSDDGKLIPQHETTTTSPLGGVRHAGGSGLASTANDYIKVLISLLVSDGRLLKPETVEYMFQPHLKDPKHLRKMHANPEAFGLAGNIPPGLKVDFGLGGIMNLEKMPTGRSPGGLQWGGYPNLFWWMNPKDGICGCYFSQLVPPGDPESFEMYRKFETEVNRTFKREMVRL